MLLGGCESLSEGLSLLREAVASDQASIVREMEIFAFATPAWSMDGLPIDHCSSRGEISLWLLRLQPGKDPPRAGKRAGRSKSEPSSTSDLLRPTARIDQFLLMHSARLDNWREITGLAEKWQAGAAQRADLDAAVAAMEAVEGYHAYPGPKLFALLRERIAANDAGGAARLARRISNGLMTRAYRERPSEWDPNAEMGVDEVADIMPPGLEGSERRRPYCEVLFVSAQPAARWPTLADEVRRLRRPEDEFVYEPVFVGSFEDAFCAAAVNPALTSVVVPEGFPFRSRFEAPVLRAVLDTLGVAEDRDTSALRLAGALKRIRPELDVFLLSERNVEDLAGDPAADCVRRVFYAVEEPLELHLSILEGVRDRYETPFFDNLKRYARRPIGTFHALPIARGKSVFKSDWIRDMGEFYGINLFLAESSATTGGLDSLLEPTGNIKRAQEMAARAFGADHVFFVTNGTSTSNKMVVQALLAPGDIALVDRNCHKSHHYGMVLSGVQPVYVEAFPMTEYSMYGAVPLRDRSSGRCSALRAEGRLDRVKLLDLTNCTFDGHMYNVRRVMEECLAIKPDLIFLWDEAWSGFARFSPFLRPRTAMGAAADIEAWLRDPASVEAYEAKQRELGDSPSDETLMDARLVPDPRKVRLRVYQTNSTHKSMSAIRQGSMLLVKDVDFHTVEAQFREAVFTHASTSPNQQLIASLDVARRQMELEGYGLVMNAIEIALEDPRGDQHPSADLALFPRARRRRHDPVRVPAVRVQGLPRARDHLGRRRPRHARGRVLSRPDAHDARLRHRRVRRHPVQGPAGERVRHPAQQDLAQQRAAAIEHQQHPQRRRPAHPRAGRDRARHREPARHPAARRNAPPSRPASSR